MIWRDMTAGDVAAVIEIAAIAFPDHPEPPETFAARAALAGAINLALDDGAGGIAGYLFAHRWPLGAIPSLGHAPTADEAQGAGWYLSDLALLPGARGAGHSRAAVSALLARTDGPVALVAVNRSAPFWERHGFAEGGDSGAALASYGADARYLVRHLR